jgi:opacity protein-like surface antigen
MKSIILVPVAALALSPIAAHAQNGDFDVNFDGPKVGLEVSRARTTLEVAPPAGRTETETSRDGVGYRAFAGYDLQVDRFVVGAELGIGGGARTVSQAGRNGTVTVDPGLSFDATARAGVAIIPELLVYGRGGYRWLRTETKIGTAAATDVTEKGFTYGGGMELALSPNLSLRAEYNRTDLSPDLRDNRIAAGATIRF